MIVKSKKIKEQMLEDIVIRTRYIKHALYNGDRHEALKLCDQVLSLCRE